MTRPLPAVWSWTRAGVVGRRDLAAGTCGALAAASVPAEPGHQAWSGHDLRRLHVSASGLFAAVVNDYGRLGEVIDVRSGQLTMALDNGGGHEETVPFSLAFARHRGRDMVIHRTAWNRLDVSDAAGGRLLTAASRPAICPVSPGPGTTSITSTVCSTSARTGRGSSTTAGSGSRPASR